MAMSGLQPQNAQTNLFKLGTYTSIPYRVFVNLSSNDRTVLYQAEWSIRKKNPNALVKAINNELWSFSLDESVQPCGPSKSYDLRETSTGIFLASTLNDDTNVPPPYQSFLHSVKSLLCTRLSCTHNFIPFGTDGLSLNGELYYISPYLTPYGDLMAKMHYSDVMSGLKNPIIGNLDKNSKVVFIPSALTARFIEPCDPPRLYYNTFLQLLELSTTIDFTSLKLFKFRKWAVFKLDYNERLVTWPLDLCLVPSVNDGHGLLLSQYSSLHSRDTDMNWISVQDIFSEVTNQISSIAAVISDTKVPHAPRADIGLNSEEETASHHSVNPYQNQHISDDVKKGPSTVYPTPPDPQSRPRNEGDTVESSNWITPGAANTNMESDWGDLDADLFGDNDEITEADFNFFDQPQLEIEKPPQPSEKLEPSTHEDGHHLQKDHEPDSILLSTEEEKKVSITTTTPTTIDEAQKVPKKASVTPDLTIKSEPNNLLRGELLYDQQINIFNEKDTCDESRDPPSKRIKTGVFSALSFNSAILKNIDTKYDIGGRFFVPNSIESDESSSDEESNDDDQASSMLEIDSDKMDTQSRTAYSSTSPEIENSKEKSIKVNDWITAMISNSTYVDYVSLTYLNQPSFPEILSDNTVFEAALNIFVDQIVWDSSLFSLSSLEEDQGMLNYTMVKRLNEIFNGMECVSLFDLIRYKRADASDNSNLVTDDSKYFDGTTTNESSAIVENGAQSEITEQAQSNARQQRERNSSPSPKVFRIPSPMYSVNRLGQLMKAQAPILRFWKIFGLNPVSGHKNCRAFTMCPTGPGIISDSEFFLNYFKSTYEGCGLGELLIGAPREPSENVDESISQYIRGITSYSFDDGNIQITVDNITRSINHLVNNVLEDLSKIRQQRNRQPENGNKQSKSELLIIIINPFDNPGHLFCLCRGLYNILEAFDDNSVNINLQVVSPSLVSSKDSVSVTSQARMVKFSLGIYDRIMVSKSNSTSGSNGNSASSRKSQVLQRELPAYTLARTSPFKINFRLSSTPSLSLMNEESFLHVGYSVSADKKWVAVAWSDQWGELSKIRAYSVGRGSSSGLFEDVIKEIWISTLELTQRLKVRWRIVVTKCGSMEKREFGYWNQLIEAADSKTLGSCFILSIPMKKSLLLTSELDGDFLFSFYDSSSSSKPQNAATPVTPQKNIDNDSPDTLGINISTPTSGLITTALGSSQQSDYLLGDKKSLEDMVIVDIKDDTYGIVLEDEQLHKILEHSPSYQNPLNVGLLVKPGPNLLPYATKDCNQNMAQCLEVHLLRNPIATDGVLKSLLFQYRRLASLGTFTGISRISNSIVPWHINATARMIRALDCIM